MRRAAARLSSIRPLVALALAAALLPTTAFGAPTPGPADAPSVRPAVSPVPSPSSTAAPTVRPDDEPDGDTRRARRSGGRRAGGAGLARIRAVRHSRPSAND